MPNKAPERYFAKCLTSARTKEIRLPPVLTTARPHSRFPRVACHRELSMTGWYSHTTGITTSQARGNARAANTRGTKIIVSHNHAEPRIHSPPYAPSYVAYGAAPRGTL